MKRLIQSVIRQSGLGDVAITVPAGINRRMRWTLFPWTSYWRGTHEPPVQQLIRQLPDLAGSCCWDLGAHYGFYSIALARLVGPSGQVVAFEPNPHTFRKLQRHRDLNDLKHLLLFQAGASRTSEVLTLLRYEGPETTATHFAYSGEDIAKAPHHETVRVMALDDLVDAGTIRVPAFIKIDVEGHAHHALAGALRSIARARPTILLALHCEEERHAVTTQLLPLGYTAADLAGNPLPSVPEIGDIVLRAN